MLNRLPMSKLSWGRSQRSIDQAGDHQAWAVAQALSGAHQPGGAVHAADPCLAHAARQRGARPAPRALRSGQRAAAARLSRLVPCRERRRGQCRAAGDRHHRRRAAGDPHAAHHRHRHLGAAGARRGCRAACCINMCRSTIRPSCSASCTHWRPDLAVLVEVGDLAQPRARDQGARHSPAAHQWPHVGVAPSSAGGGGRA